MSFSIDDYHMVSNHFSIQISLDKPPKRNTSLTEPCYQFDKKKNDDSLHNTLKDSLKSIDTDITAQDELEELVVTLCDKLMKAATQPHLKCTAAMTPNLLLAEPS